MIGKRIRELRLSQGLSVSDLARMTDLTPSFISQVERDVTNVSLQSLRQICKALNVPLFQLFLDHDDVKRKIVRADERRVLRFSGSPVEYELLSPAGPDYKIELLMMTLEKGQSNVAEPFGHQGEEAVFVLEGQMQVELGNETHVLNEGDCIYFDSNIPHRYLSIDEKPLRAIIAVTPPSY